MQVSWPAIDNSSTFYPCNCIPLSLFSSSLAFLPFCNSTAAVEPFCNSIAAEQSIGWVYQKAFKPFHPARRWAHELNKEFKREK
ncbi:hypothetical protein AB3S75_039973 [Citrus x aurantiifolia]